MNSILFFRGGGNKQGFQRGMKLSTEQATAQRCSLLWKSFRLARVQSYLRLINALLVLSSKYSPLALAV